MKYNYVVLGDESVLYQTSYSDLYDKPYACYIPDITTNMNVLKKFIFRLHFSSKINRYINLPFKHLWAHHILDFSFKDSKPICFLFFSPWVRYDGLNLAQHLKTIYPTCKCVWFIQDLFTKQITTSLRHVSIDYAISQFDHIISFDQNDCLEYGFIYHPLVFSSFHGKTQEMPESDIYFVGKAKGRLKMLIEIYEKLKENNVSCDFHIAGVPVEERVYKDEIDYNPHISYTDNLQHVIHTKCLLELMQPGGAGFTQRGCEAVCFDKMLLTNNPTISQQEFYNEKYICQISNANDIPHSFIEAIKRRKCVDYHYKEQLSPIALLQFIDDLYY